MLQNQLSSLLLSSIITLNTLGATLPLPKTELASQEISLENRQPDPYINSVFKENILLNYAYLRGLEKSSTPNWDEVKKSSEYSFILKKGETFAFHDDTLPEFNNPVKTSNAHFNGTEGFKSDGYLMGNGVCHFASLLYWAAKDAGLSAVAPTNHDFAAIPDISKEYGVAIYDEPGMDYNSQRQNLYITNNNENDVEFSFKYDGEKLKVAVSEVK